MWQLLTLLVGVLVCGCARLPETGAVEVGGDESLYVGVATELTGPLAREGRSIANGAVLAAERFGSAYGHRVEVDVADGGCETQEAEETVSRFLQAPRLVGVIGPVCSAGCVAAVGVLKRPDVPMVTPRCTDIAVTRQGYGGVFRTVWSDGAEAAGASEFAKDHLRIRRAFVVNDGTVYARGMREAFKAFFGKGRLVGNYEALTGSEDYGPVIRSIQKSNAGMVYYAGFADDAARFVSQLRAAGVTLPVFVPDAVKDEQAFVAAAGETAEGVYVTEVVPETGRSYADFARAYYERWGEPPGPYAAEGYDAMMVLLQAVEETARQRRGRLRIDRSDLIGSLARTDIKGVSGRIRYRPGGDRIDGASVRVLQVRGGRFVEQKVIEFDD